MTRSTSDRLCGEWIEICTLSGRTATRRFTISPSSSSPLVVIDRKMTPSRADSRSKMSSNSKRFATAERYRSYAMARAVADKCRNLVDRPHGRAGRVALVAGQLVTEKGQQEDRPASSRKHVNHLNCPQCWWNSSATA